MMRCALVACVAGNLVASAPAAAQTQEEWRRQVLDLSARLALVWNDEIKRGIGVYAGERAAACVADTGLSVTSESEIVPSVGSDNAIRIPFYYVQFQLSASQAPAFHVLGVPEAADLTSLFSAQEAIFDDLRAAVADGSRRAPIRVESVFGRMGMTAERYSSLNEGFARSPSAMAVGNAFGFAFEFVMLHEAGHLLDRCSGLDAFTSAHDPELRADDFAFAMLTNEKIPVVLSLEPLRTIAAFEGQGALGSARALATCRLARGVNAASKLDAHFFAELKIPSAEAEQFSSRTDSLMAFYRSRYPLSSCAGYR